MMCDGIYVFVLNSEEVRKVNLGAFLCFGYFQFSRAIHHL